MPVWKVLVMWIDLGVYMILVKCTQSVKYYQLASHM